MVKKFWWSDKCAPSYGKNTAFPLPELPRGWGLTLWRNERVTFFFSILTQFFLKIPSISEIKSIAPYSIMHSDAQIAHYPFHQFWNLSMHLMIWTESHVSRLILVSILLWLILMSIVVESIETDVDADILQVLMDSPCWRRHIYLIMNGYVVGDIL